MTLDDEKIILVPLDRVDENKQSSTRYCFTEMTAELRISLAEAVKRYNETFPEETTSQPNLANKLRRGGLKDYELARYAYALGYRLALIPTKEKPKPIIKSKTNEQETFFDYFNKPDERIYWGKDYKELSFDELLQYGFASISTPNFSNVFIAGRFARDALAFLDENIKNAKTPTDELILFTQAEKDYFVKIKPIK